MTLCFPVAVDNGIHSQIYGHFASAPFFVLLDVDTRQSSLVANCDCSHPYGGCNPFSALRGRQLDGIIVDAIGDDAVRTMNLCGYKIFQAASTSLTANLELFRQGALPEVEIMQSHLEGRCSGGENGCNCSVGQNETTGGAAP